MPHPYDEDLRIGDRIAGRYEILAVIGHGSMGVVYKCRHDILGRVVAIKTLRLQRTTDDRSQRRFEREARLAHRLEHPNLISVQDFGYTAAGDPFLIMDFVSGEQLFEVLKREKHIDPERAINLFSQVCDGLYHAHQRGVIHRDLKPANMLVVARENAPESVKIVDLGVAKIVQGSEEEEADAITMTGEVCGSPIYLSPEQCMYQELDARTDIYSLGVCMYECLTGVAPLRGATVYDTIYMHVHDTPRPFNVVAPQLEIPKRLEEIVFKCLSKQAKDRYETMMQLKHELLGALKTSGAAATLNVLSPEQLFGATPGTSKASPAEASSKDQEQVLGARAKRSANSPEAESKRPRTKSNQLTDKANHTVPTFTLALPSIPKLVIICTAASVVVGLSIGLGFAAFVSMTQPKKELSAQIPNHNFEPKVSGQAAENPKLESNQAIANANPYKGSSSSKVKASSKGSTKIAKKLSNPASAHKASLESFLPDEHLQDGSERKFFSAIDMPKNNSQVPMQKMQQFSHNQGGASRSNMALNALVKKIPKGGIEAFKNFVASQSGGSIFPGQQQAGSTSSNVSFPSSNSAQPAQFPSFAQGQQQARQSGGLQNNGTWLRPGQTEPQQEDKQASAEKLANEGASLYGSRQYLAAVKKFEAAYRLNQTERIRHNYALALNAYANQLNNEAHYEEAVDFSRKAVDLFPDNTTIQNNAHKFSVNLDAKLSGTLQQ